MLVAHTAATHEGLPRGLAAEFTPVMSMDLADDGEGAVPTTLFTVTYSLLFVSARGYGESKICSRSEVSSDGGVLHDGAFGEFRVVALSKRLFAIGNSPQNPVAFSMIPELFLRNKNIALSAVHRLSTPDER